MKMLDTVRRMFARSTCADIFINHAKSKNDDELNQLLGKFESEVTKLENMSPILDHSEALYGFTAYLYQHPEVLAEPNMDIRKRKMAILCAVFCQANDFNDPQPGYPNRMVMPDKQYVFDGMKAQ